MKLRRGTTFWPGELGNMINQFSPGDIVSSVIADSDVLIGSVRSVHPRINKVMVAWGGGSVVQHDPDEITLHPHMNDFLVQRLSDTRVASRRTRDANEIEFIENKMAKELLAEDVPPDFQGNPKVHGIDEPRGGGFSIMQNLQEDLVKEEQKEREGSEKYAMYWSGPGRTYRLTKLEQNGGSVACPKCRTQMDNERFTRNERMFRCPDCGFKIPTGKVVKKKIEIEIEPNGEIEVEVTEASCRRMKRRTHNGF
jgi:DNA-directed RNA polymerase subunit RPC12/RpoP